MRLTSDPADESQPVWSPDGQTIAYVANDGTRQLRVIKATGGPSTVLAPPARERESRVFAGRPAHRELQQSQQ